MTRDISSRHQTSRTKPNAHIALQCENKIEQRGGGHSYQRGVGGNVSGHAAESGQSTVVLCKGECVFHATVQSHTDETVIWVHQSAAFSPVSVCASYNYALIAVHLVQVPLLERFLASFTPRSQTLQPSVRIHAANITAEAISLPFYFIEEINEQYKVQVTV